MTVLSASFFARNGNSGSACKDRKFRKKKKAIYHSSGIKLPKDTA